jgi:hypothetical protein
LVAETILMGMTEVKRKAVDSLRSGRFQSEPEGVLKGKNLLGAGGVSAADVIDLLHRCRGPQYCSGPHHFDAGTTVHIFQPTRSTERWYIKFYFVILDDCDVMFMIVHECVHRGS